MIDRFRARLARRSFDYQWRWMPEGAGLLSDSGFASRVDSILSESELRIDRRWFAGKQVLDAGCGNGRWIEGFLRLGSEVTAIDVSEAALRHVRRVYGDRIRVLRGSILEADSLLAGQEFDLVFSWGVLHHTENAADAMKTLARLVKQDGFLYLYLYGKESVSARGSLQLGAKRFALSLLPLSARRRLIEHMYGKEQAHATFDLLSTPLNKRFSLKKATALLHEAGFTQVVQTMPHTELFLRADFGRTSADPFLLPTPSQPYWFEELSA